MNDHDATVADGIECDRLTRRLLTDGEREALDRAPDWSLNPPQREEYTSPSGYVAGLRAYARRVMAKDAETCRAGRGEGSA